MPSNHELPRQFDFNSPRPGDIPDRVDTGGLFLRSTSRFKQNIARGVAKERETKANLARLKVTQPTIQISPKSFEDGSFLSTLQTKYEYLTLTRLSRSTRHQELDSLTPLPSDDPLVYLGKCELITFSAAAEVASRELPKVGIKGAGPIHEVIVAGFEEDMITPKGFDRNGIPNYMAFLPPFESEVFQRLVAAQFAKRRILEMEKFREYYGSGKVVEKAKPERWGVKRIIYLHESTRRYGYNDHTLLHYLAESFRFNLSYIAGQHNLTEKESELYAYMAQWGKETAIGYDTRGDNLRGKLMSSATQWLVPTEQLLP